MYNNAILMIDAGVLEILYSAITPIMGVYMLNVALEGFMDRPVPVWQRVLMVAGSLALIKLGIITDLIGAAILVFVIFSQKAAGKKQAAITRGV